MKLTEGNKIILLPLVRKYRAFHELKLHHNKVSVFWNITSLAR